MDTDSPTKPRHALLLAKAIRQVMHDLHNSPPQQYTHDEWVWFLKLMEE